MQQPLLSTDTNPYNGHHLCHAGILAVTCPEGGFSIVERPQKRDQRLGSNRLTELRITGPLQRRDRHDIIAEILRTAKGGQKKTYIMYSARLSHSQLKLYLDLLDRNGLLVCDDGLYKTTRKGLNFIKDFESINFLFNQ